MPGWRVSDAVEVICFYWNWESPTYWRRHDSIRYQDILAKNVNPSVKKFKLGCQYTSQQDNDPNHASISTKAWLDKKGWKVLERPPQSPDLNPIENLWWDLKKAVAARRPTGIADLETIAQEERAKIPTERCEEPVRGYSSCLQEVIAANGCCTSTKIHTHVGWLTLKLAF